VILRNDDIKAQMISQKIGIGQLLAERRKTGKEEPTYKLIACGKIQDSILSRQYSIDVPGVVSFLIHEEVYLDVLLGKALHIADMWPLSSTKEGRDGLKEEGAVLEREAASWQRTGRRSSAEWASDAHRDPLSTITQAQTPSPKVHYVHNIRVRLVTVILK
jgi:hypothetical protein